MGRLSAMTGINVSPRPWAIILCLFIACLVTACASDGQKSVTVHVPPSEDVLRVGVSPTAPPLIYKEGDDIVGLEADLAKGLAKSLGKSLRFIELPWEDQIEALLDNRTDIVMSGMSITIPRQYRIAFSDPYFRTGQMPLVRKQDKIDKYKYTLGYYGILTMAPILRIGVVKGTTGEFFGRKDFGSAKKITPFLTAKEAVSALKDRDIDLFIYDAPMIYALAAENEADVAPLLTLLTEEYLGWGMRKNNEELLAAANAFIKKLRKDGELLPMVNRWLPLAR
jgi:polar amino acid transport system substrate-binding protein